MLKVTAAGHWMGESFSAKTMPPIQIEAKGTDSISQIDVLVDGELRKSFKCQGAEEKLIYEPEAGLSGKHIFFVRLEQSDGNHAWASPLWVDIH